MKDTGLKTRLVLQRDFGVSTPVRKSNLMPEPLYHLILSADHPLNVPTYTLLEGSLRYYPLEIEDFMRGDTLRAHFKCVTKDRIVTTRFTSSELKAEESLLLPFADENVASWNIVQLRTAKILMDNAPKEGRAVSTTVLEAIHRAPHSFYQALTSRASPGLH